MGYADSEESPMTPEKLAAGLSMALMLACVCIAVCGRLAGNTMNRTLWHQHGFREGKHREQESAIMRGLAWRRIKIWL